MDEDGSRDEQAGAHAGSAAVGEKRDRGGGAAHAAGCGQAPPPELEQQPADGEPPSEESQADGAPPDASQETEEPPPEQITGVVVSVRHIVACRPLLLHHRGDIDGTSQVVLPMPLFNQLRAEHAELRVKARELIPELTLRCFADHLARAERVVVATGAGISVSAGIPDFRTKGTGLYSQLEEYGLSRPQDIFDIEFFRQRPAPFYHLAQKMWPGQFRPTRTHLFIRLLHRKGKLLRNYTQNIDDLERVAGVPPEKLFQAHGTFSAAHCVDCSAKYDADYVREHLERDEWPRCSSTPLCAVREMCDSQHRGLVKPTITFFGEPLSEDFAREAADDLEDCDALIVLGTSLQVRPFCMLPALAKPYIPRLMINRDAREVGHGAGFVFDPDWAVRDVSFDGDCDDGVTQLCDMLGWRGELEALVAEDRAAAAAAGAAPAAAGHGGAAAPAGADAPREEGAPPAGHGSSVHSAEGHHF